MRKTLSALAPKWMKRFISALVIQWKTLPYLGWGRWCPVCGMPSRKFGEYGVNPRKDALCIHCGSLERHRFVWLYFHRKTNLFDGASKRMLHVAAEQCFEGKLKKKLGEGYITADLFDPKAMIKMDVMNIQYENEYFEVIYCSHVLEHVPDDRKALREFYRVLKPNGWAVLLVPITVEKTVEDPSIKDPAERRRLFGQEDHVRSYGPDYVDRLREAGFEVKVSRVSDLVSDADAKFMGLASSGDIYYCSKT